MISKEESNEKVSEGWLRIWFAFEALAISEEVAKKALENLFAKIESDTRIKIYKKEFSPGSKVENPVQGVKEGWSVVCEIEFVAKKFDDLVHVVMEYGPSAVEILEANNLKLGIEDCQNILNGVSDMMHRFAAAGVGGVVIRGD